MNMEMVKNFFFLEEGGGGHTVLSFPKLKKNYADEDFEFVSECFPLIILIVLLVLVICFIISLINGFLYRSKKRKWGSFEVL